MRDIRDKKHQEYEQNPQLRETRLTEIKEKYTKKIRSQETTSN